MKLLDAQQIRQKTKRLAIEILEHNYDESSVILVGINNTGVKFAEQLRQQMVGITDVTVMLTQVKLNPANPLANPIVYDYPLDSCTNKVIIIVDDVANTGRTLHYAMKPFLEVLPKKIEVCVLIDRKHKSFPIAADYVGMTLATTLQDNIEVKLLGTDEEAVYLN